LPSPPSVPQGPVRGWGALLGLMAAIAAVTRWLPKSYRTRKLALAAPVVALLLFGLALTGCAGASATNSTLGTPTGTYTLTITATSPSGSGSMNLTLTVK
jgi:hypothetical protein